MNQTVDLEKFVTTITRSGACDRLVVHARQALLNGISPKDNRTIPPLNYNAVFALKAKYSGLAVEINGGITSLDQAEALLLPPCCENAAAWPREATAAVDGVMIGRAASADPWLFSDADRRIFGAADGNPLTARSRAAAVRSLLPYGEAMLARGESLHYLTRHLSALCKGLPHGRRIRQLLSRGRRPGTSRSDNRDHDLGLDSSALARGRGTGLEAVAQAADLIEQAEAGLAERQQQQQTQQTQQQKQTQQQTQQLQQ